MFFFPFILEMQIKHKLLTVFGYDILPVSSNGGKWESAASQQHQSCLYKATPQANSSSLLPKHWAGRSWCMICPLQASPKGLLPGLFSFLQNAPAPPVCILHSKEMQKHKLAVSKKNRERKSNKSKRNNHWQSTAGQSRGRRQAGRTQQEPFQ